MHPISKNQYDLYVFFTRNSLAEFFNEELEWYINESKTLWAVICRDHQDQDYTVIFSARDENRQIRCIDVKTNLPDLKAARKFMLLHAKELEKKNNVTPKKHKDIFIPIKEADKLNKSFVLIYQYPSHSAAKNLIQELMPHFMDVDGNFIEQFQTQGFDARLWELFLFCYFNEEGLTIDRSNSAPDFLLSYNQISVGVEAVVVANKEKSLSDMLPPMENMAFKQETMAAKWGSSLYSKLTHVNKAGKHYWEYPHTQNKPFVLAIADFHENLSMTWSYDSLITYLYGYRYSYFYDENQKLQIIPDKVESHPRENNAAPIPSGFFFQKEAENISAVLHSSCATISKFNRIGKQCGLDNGNTYMYRIGTFYNPDPDAAKPLTFSYLVSEQNTEPWSEGVTIFHNPNAKIPLPKDVFLNAAHCYLNGEYIETESSNCIVFSSVTLINIAAKN